MNMEVQSPHALSPTGAPFSPPYSSQQSIDVVSSPQYNPRAREIPQEDDDLFGTASLV